MKTFLTRLTLFLVSLFLVLEFLVFRLFLPACEEPAYVLDPVTSLPTFDASYGISGTYTFGRIPRIGAEWRVNNAGWISAYDYHPRAEGDPTYRIAVLGDSYIENFYTALDQHIDVLLAEMLGPGFEVWGFGRSGAYLYQYVIMVEEIDRLYDPDLFVIFLNRNDVRSSLADLGTPTRFYYQLASSDTGYVEIPPAPFSRSRFRRLLRHSALLRYLNTNTRLGLFANAQREENIAALVTSLSEMRQDTVLMAEMSDVTEFMLDKLRREHEGKSFVFVGDALRPPIYEGSSEPERFIDCEIVREICETKPNFSFMDMVPVYSEAWESDQRRFEYDNNWHWDAYGNQVVSEGLHRFLLEQHLLL